MRLGLPVLLRLETSIHDQTLVCARVGRGSHCSILNLPCSNTLVFGAGCSSPPADQPPLPASPQRDALGIVSQIFSVRAPGPGVCCGENNLA
eukprot:1841361-Rhodomonas_salina.2